MADNVQSAMLEILKKIQEQLAEQGRQLEKVDRRFDRLEELNRKQRRDSAGMLVMVRATAGDFDQRVSDVEARMDALEAGRS
jgi:NADP-dependent 3-hydroxy acid dehydrogenase YdfG